MCERSRSSLDKVGGARGGSIHLLDGDKGHCACRRWGEELKLQPRLRDVQILER